MVKFGYAENLEEITLERLKYDILYIENMSFLIDLKIMIHTVLITSKEEEIIKWNFKTTYSLSIRATCRALITNTNFYFTV